MRESRKGARRHVVWLLNAIREEYDDGGGILVPTFSAARDGDVVLVVAAGSYAEDLRDLVERGWEGVFQDASLKAKREDRWSVAAARTERRNHAV